jgi:hypothetical protein
MPKRFTDGYFALGLTVGLFSAIIFGLFISSGYQPDTQLAYAVDQGSNHTNQCGNGNEPVWGPWFGLCFGLYDSIAQWMIMVFTIVAAVLLYGTLIQANKTNLAAIKAATTASETNQILRDEQRPWVALERDLTCEFSDLGHAGKISWNYDLENKSLGLAHDIKVDWVIIKRHHFQNMGNQLREYLDEIISKQQRSQNMAVLFPRERTKYIKYRFSGVTRYREDRFSGDPTFFGEGTHFMLMVCVTYRLSAKSDEFGFDVRMFGIERPPEFIGPWGHTILEYSNARLIG